MSMGTLLHRVAELKYFLVCFRENHKAVYISPAHERESFGKWSPGPHAVGRMSFDSMGVQANSMRRSNPRFAVQKSHRFLKLKCVSDRENWPSPASYNF